MAAPEDPALQVVLVHWEQPERCIETVAAFRAQDVAVRIMIVDNGSSADALDKLRANLDDVELVELGTNTGFGPGANAGLRRWLADPTRSDWVALAPHDALPQEGCLARALAAVRARPRAGLACADVGDGERPVVDPDFGGITLPIDHVADDGWVDAGYPHGTLLFGARRCLDEVGLFDERYFAYCEEADLGERARRAGWQVGLVTGAEVRNPYLGGGSAVVDYLMLRNTLLLVRDRFGRYKVSIRFAMAVWQLGAAVARRRSRSLVFAPRARARALVDFARGRFGPPPPGLR
jgi:N-acetylglucosaminyl-diphospho-decaprenol L-rhamnosyltransferase